MFKILLAEDEVHLSNLIKKHLQQNGYIVETAHNGEAALAAFCNQSFDLLLTDIMMPKMDGNELSQAIKKIKSDFPIIMLTALDSISDKRKSFSLGADDYISKPVDYEELMLRINSLLRRCKLVSSQSIMIGDVELNFACKSLKVAGSAIETTRKEFLLLYMLLSSPDRIYSRSQILDEIWGYDTESLERTVDVHINKIREKLQSSTVDIATVRGLGYKAVVK